MTTSTVERQDVGGAEQTPTWICDNCRAETSAVRKRCTDCGTSRY